MNRINNPLVTIGIPVYNVEKFVANSLNSVLQQDYPNIEILIMYDESIDNSYSIINEILSDSRIPFRIIDNTGNHSSIGIARNTIIDNYNGDYLFFLDSDDILETDCISILISRALRYNAEIVKSSHRSVDFNGNILNEFTYAQEKLVDDWFLKEYRYVQNNFDPIYSWNKLYSRSFLEKHEMRYKHNFHEDAFFTFLEIQNATRVILVPRITYNYLIRPNSLTTSETNFEKISVFVDNYDYINDYFKSSKSLYSNCCVVDYFMMKYIMVVRDSVRSKNLSQSEKRFLLKKAFETPDLLSKEFFKLLKSKRKRVLLILLVKMLPFYLNVALVYAYHILKGNRVEKVEFVA